MPNRLVRHPETLTDMGGLGADDRRPPARSAGPPGFPAGPHRSRKPANARSWASGSKAEAVPRSSPVGWLVWSTAEAGKSVAEDGGTQEEKLRLRRPGVPGT